MRCGLLAANVHLIAVVCLLVVVVFSECKAVTNEWTNYHDQAALETKLIEINMQCPEFTRTYSIGQSVQGRELVAIEFSTTPGGHKLCRHFLIILHLYKFLTSAKGLNKEEIECLVSLDEEVFC